MTKHNMTEWLQELEADPNQVDSKLHRSTKKANNNKKTLSKPVIDAELAALIAQDNQASNFNFTYQASRHERQWLLASLGSFYEHHWIDDVLRLVKSGKEASVYLCRANPSVNEEFLAVKVYRPRMLRNLKNDALYREGRTDLDADGNQIFDHKLLNAIRKRSAYGQEIRHTSWLEHEYTTLQRLHTAGADVPKPYACEANAILMSYIGEEGFSAPVLSSIHLRKEEARFLFKRVLRNVNIMLDNGIIHGDLSAYNILYWEGKITLIDFPQVVSPGQNLNALRIFERDLARVCEYFKHQGVPTPPHKLVVDLWTAHHYRITPEVHPALLDDQDEGDVAYWKALQEKG
jgi:RIO kinase 1